MWFLDIAGKDVDLKLEETKLKSVICTTFVFCYVWAIGGNLKSTSWDAFDTFVRGQFEENPDAKLPGGGDLFSYYVDVKNRRMELWEKIVPKFAYNRELPYFEIMVPTIDSTRYGYLMEKLLTTKRWEIIFRSMNYFCQAHNVFFRGVEFFFLF